MKVFFDIITNHTADVIATAEPVQLHAKADAPYKDANGNAFDDRDYVDTADVPADERPVVPVHAGLRQPSDATAKSPAWLNDRDALPQPRRLDLRGRERTYGDFFGLDDLFTERPEVLHGMEDIYKAWVDFGIDGFRIDTVKHVNTEFWHSSRRRCSTRRRPSAPNFFMFGEVFDADPAFQCISRRRQAARDARLRVPGSTGRVANGDQRTSRTSTPTTTTTPTPTRTRTTCRPSSATTTWAASADLRQGGSSGQASNQYARECPDVHAARPTGRLLRRRAGLRRRRRRPDRRAARTCSPPRSRPTTTTR